MSSPQNFKHGIFKRLPARAPSGANLQTDGALKRVWERAVRCSGGKYLSSALEETTLAGHHTRRVSSSHEGEERDGVVAVDSWRRCCEAVERRRGRVAGSDAARMKSSREVRQVETDRGQGRAVRGEGQLLAVRAPGERREEGSFVPSD